MHHTTMNSLCLAAIILAATLSGNVQGGDEKGVTYSVIAENDFAGVRRSIDVRLNSKVSSQILHSIAWKIKKAESLNYERTFIFYWLPGMKVGSGAWATTHFDPELEIQILGLTQEEEERMARETTSQSRDIVGVWLDDRPYVGATLTLPASCITFLSEQAFAPQNTRFWSRRRVWFQFTVGEDKPPMLSVDNRGKGVLSMDCSAKRSPL